MWPWQFKDVFFIVPYRLLFSGETRTISKLYRGALALDCRDRRFNLSPKDVNILDWKTYFPQTLPKQKPEPAEQTIGKLQPADTDKLTPTEHQVLEQLSVITPECSEADLAESVIMPASNNPGFDLAFFEKETGGVDCTYSNHYDCLLTHCIFFFFFCI
jgi:hypothetical protein